MLCSSVDPEVVFEEANDILEVIGSASIEVIMTKVNALSKYELFSSPSDDLRQLISLIIFLGECGHSVKKCVNLCIHEGNNLSIALNTLSHIIRQI